MSFIAALPMYDWPETRAETDEEWRRLGVALRGAGIDAPETIMRRNADMPPVSGGISDKGGAVIAPDPAALPPDELDFPTLWRHPDLLIAQTCWGPLELGLAADVQVVGQPSYEGIEGGQGTMYSSAILMRREVGPDRRRQRSFAPPSGPEGGNTGRRHFSGVSPAADGTPITPLDLLRGRRFAYNSPDSMSGFIALRRDLETTGESLETVFAERIETGAHRASIIAVAGGRADVCAVDCRSWHMAERHEPAAKAVQVVGWTGLRKGLPMITSRHTPPDIVEKLIEILGPA